LIAVDREALAAQVCGHAGLVVDVSVEHGVFAEQVAAELLRAMDEHEPSAAGLTEALRLTARHRVNTVTPVTIGQLPRIEERYQAESLTTRAVVCSKTTPRRYD